MTQHSSHPRLFSDLTWLVYALYKHYKLIPEDLIFDSDKLQAICGDLPPVDSIDDSKAKLKAVADSTGYDFGNLISILTTSFIKTKNEDYQYILALLKSIVER